MKWRVTYRYLATGMEGRADVQDYGVVEADTADEARRVAARQRNPDRPDLAQWDFGCLSVESLEHPGPRVVGGKLFFRLVDRSTVTCECIGEPYASQIVELFERQRSALQNARNILRDGRYLYADRIDELFPEIADAASRRILARTDRESDK